MPLPGLVGDSVEQAHHAAAFGEQRLAGIDVGGERLPQRRLRREPLAVQFGITTRQPDRVALGQGVTGERRKEDELGAECAQAVQVGRVEEAEGCVARDGDAAAGELGLDRGRLCVGDAREVESGRQRGGRGRRQQVGQAVEARVEFGDLGRGQQAQVALGQRAVGVAHE